MSRCFASIAVACLFSALIPASAFAQAKPAVDKSTPTPAAAPAKFVPQVKGEGSVDFVLLKGQVIKGFTIVSPNKPDLYSNRLMFKHANGIVKPSPVKKIE
jgi:hypothetical protein